MNLSSISLTMYLLLSYSNCYKLPMSIIEFEATPIALYNMLNQQSFVEF